MQHAYVQLKLKNKNSNLIKFKYDQSSNSNSELNSSANRQLSGSGCGNLIPTWIFCEFDLCTSNATTKIAYCWSNSCVPNFIAAGIQPTLIVAAACCKHNCIQSWKYGRHWLMLQQQLQSSWNIDYCLQRQVAEQLKCNWEIDYYCRDSCKHIAEQLKCSKMFDCFCVLQDQQQCWQIGWNVSPWLKWMFNHVHSTWAAKQPTQVPGAQQELT